MCAVLVLGVTAARAAEGATLQALFQGASMTSGITKFHDWQLISLDYTGAAAPNLSQILVVPHQSFLVDPYLDFLGGGQLAAAGINSLDLVFKYRVSVIPGSSTLVGHQLALDSIASAASGVAYISSEIVNEPASSLGTTVVYANHQQNNSQYTSSVSFAPKSQVSVITHIFLNGITISDSINLMTFSAHFDQSGPLSIRGDYNQDGKVDAADYTLWRDNVGTTKVLPNDFVGGTIGVNQYNQWRSHFGESWAAASSAATSWNGTPTAVPEPASAIGVVALASLILIRRQRA